MSNRSFFHRNATLSFGLPLMLMLGLAALFVTPLVWELHGASWPELKSVCATGRTVVTDPCR